MIKTLSTDAAHMPGGALRQAVCGVLVLLALLWASLPAQAQNPTPAEMQRLQQLSPAEIQRLRQLSPAEREQLAAQFRQQRQGASAATRQDVDSTDDSVVKTLDSREREQETRDLLAREMQRYRDKASLPTEELQPFGYSLFAGEASTFAPITEIPIPSEYRIGPGDVIRVQLFGQQNELHELPVSRDGSIQMPRVGPVSVAGLDFDEMRRQLSKLVTERFIGVEASITLGELRSIRVFVMGEARNPGAYTVSSLSNITNALFVSGGVKVSGSLRNVRLIRNGEVISTLDIYDLLLKGDTRGDRRLMPGDVIFIPTVGKAAAIGGQVRRPAVYELKAEQSIADLLELAGGYRSEAFPRFTRIKRIGEGFDRSVENIDLTVSANLDKRLQDGDQITVGAIDELREGYVRVSGAVLRPGLHEWKPGMRLSSVLPSVKHSLKEGADLDYALIIRDINARGDIKAVSVSLHEALSAPGSDADLLLSDRDRVLVFYRDAVSDSREEYLLGPYLEKLERQVAPGQSPGIVSIGGQVRHPGRYPLTDGMTLQELIIAAGGMLDSTYLGEAEIARTILQADRSATRLLTTTVDPSRPEATEDFRLQSRDRVLIKQLPEFGERHTVTLEGEVRFPGTYTIQRGEMLSALIERAGGLTPHAYPKGAVFARAQLREQEAARLRDVEARLQRDLVGLSLDESAQFRAAAEQDTERQLENILERVQSTRPVGRMVIDLPQILAGAKAQDVRLMDGDTLTIPEHMQSVAVIGEIQYPTSHLFNSGLSVGDYLERSGGPTRNADERRIYVIRADGSVWLPNRSRWFAGRGGALEPGDTIVVPLDIDQINRLELATGLSQVIYQMALGAAAVRSF